MIFYSINTYQRDLRWVVIFFYFKVGLHKMKIKCTSIDSISIYPKMKNDDQIKVALAQISPVWLNKSRTLKKIYDYVDAILWHLEKAFYRDILFGWR